MEPSAPKRGYGHSNSLFVNRKANSDSIIVGGTASDTTRWTRVLSYRAAQMLWFYLTRYLYPEKSDMVNALVTTAPLRGSDLPTVTTHLTVDRLEDGDYELVGMAGAQSWSVQFGDQEAHRFWSALDRALYPSGWQGQTPRSV